MLRELCRDPGERLEVLERRTPPLRVAGAEAGRDELLQQRRLAPCGGPEGPQVARVEAVAREASAGGGDLDVALAVVALARPRSAVSRGRTPRGGARTRAEMPGALAELRQVELAPGSRSAGARFGAAPALPASIASLITRSGRNSSRWRRRIVSSRSTSPSEKSRYPPRVRRGGADPDPRGSGSSRSRCRGTRRAAARRPRRSCAAAGSCAVGWVVVLMEQERHSVLADLHLVVGGEIDALDPVPVDERPVEAPEVADREGVVLVDDLGVPPRDGDVVEEDVAVRRAADEGAQPADLEALARHPSTRPHDERRAAHSSVCTPSSPSSSARGSASSRRARPAGGRRRTGRSSSRPRGSGSRTPGSRRGSSRRAAEDRAEIRGVDVEPASPSRSRSARRMSIRPWSMRRRSDRSSSSRSSPPITRAQLVVRERAEVDGGLLGSPSSGTSSGALEDRALEGGRDGTPTSSVPASACVRRRPTRSLAQHVDRPWSSRRRSEMPSSSRLGVAEQALEVVVAQAREVGQRIVVTSGTSPVGDVD